MIHRNAGTFAVLLASFVVGGFEKGHAQSAFSIPREGYVFHFPRDHGSHPEFKIEWWYVTGHLHDDAHGHRFGFQLTFFRRSGPLRSETQPGPLTPPRFGNSQLYLAHVAITDPQKGKFHYRERLNRDGWNASASTSGLDVFNGSWRLRALEGPSLPIELTGDVGDAFRMQLLLVPKKPLVIFGTNGVSRKGESPDAASHYITFPRLEVSGSLIQHGTSTAVRGQAWMDHEISSSQLDRQQTGWDWTCVQFDNGCELMAYRLRRAGGGTDPASTLAWIDDKGGVTQIGPGEFEWTTVNRWRSPSTGIDYPNEVELRFAPPGHTGRERLRIRPIMRNQEIHGRTSGLAYWEGACDASWIGPEGPRLAGEAYLELAGYGSDLRPPLR